MKKMVTMFGVMLVALGVNAEPQPLCIGDCKVTLVRMVLVHAEDDSFAVGVGISVVDDEGRKIWRPFLCYFPSLRKFKVSNVGVFSFYKDYVSEIPLGPAPELPILKIPWLDFLEYRKELLKEQKEKQHLRHSEDKKQDEIEPAIRMRQQAAGLRSRLARLVVRPQPRQPLQLAQAKERRLIFATAV